MISRIGETYHHAPRVLGVEPHQVSRDTTAGAGLPLSRRVATTTSWYAEHRPIHFRGQPFYKYGLARPVPDGELVRFGSVGVVPIFAEPGATSPDVLFVLSGPGEYLPYNSVGNSICRE